MEGNLNGCLLFKNKIQINIKIHSWSVSREKTHEIRSMYHPISK